MPGAIAAAIVRVRTAMGQEVPGRVWAAPAQKLVEPLTPELLQPTPPLVSTLLSKVRVLSGTWLTVAA